MHIAIEHHRDTFNIALSSSPEKQAFLVIKGCRIKDGSKGRFISFPARKMDDGKWWNHVWANEAFTVAVLRAHDDSQPTQHKRGTDDDDVPF